MNKQLKQELQFYIDQFANDALTKGERTECAKKIKRLKQQLVQERFHPKVSDKMISTAKEELDAHIKVFATHKLTKDARAKCAQDIKKLKSQIIKSKCRPIVRDKQIT